jgi:enoyl-CoA hydratase/carnithine racemase
MIQETSVRVEHVDDVAVVTLCRPPHNFFDAAMLSAIADHFETIGRDRNLRAIVLAAEGSSFCAGADFGQPSNGPASNPQDLYAIATRIIAAPKPVIAAVQGPAIGGGLGLAVTADFRIATPKARFAANFVKLGFHPGFGLGLTLPPLIGQQRANLLFYTGRRIAAEEALAWGLIDELAPELELQNAAISLAREIAEAAPLAVQAARATQRRGLVEAFAAQTAHEAAQQTRLRETADFKEGVRAVAERRKGQFIGA